MKNIIKLFITVCFMLLSPVVMAHDNNLSQSLFTGMLHPVLGLDHLIALILSGTIIANLKSSQTTATLSIIIALAIGASGSVLIGSYEWIQSAWVEAAIIFSIPLYMALIWIQKSARTLSITLMSLFMVAHGWAHGIELSAASHNMNHLLDNAGFMFGFLLTCFSIVSLGKVLISLFINSHNRQTHASL